MLRDVQVHKLINCDPQGLYVIASAFQKLKKKPARSILFFSSTAEEQGLTGT